MAIRVALNHVTHYRFDRAVTIAPHLLRLRPASHSRTPILSYSLKVLPEKHFINWQQDPFGNFVARLVFPEASRELRIEVDLVADMTVINPFDFFLEEEVETVPFTYEVGLKKDLAPFFEISDDGPLLNEWLKGIDRSPQSTVPFLVALNQKVWETVNYNVRMEPGVQSCEETLERRVGSCRDSAWLLVQIARHLGLAARFVSGYLVQLKADEKSLDGPSGPEADFTDLHAWAEIFVPGAGWVGLDPTSGLLAGEGHIPLACTPEPASAAPVTGATGVCEVEFEFGNSVQRIHEDPRVTLPYNDATWAQINALGEQVDADLNAADVRLTMGGEPTFVSVDDMEGDEWTVQADGPVKRRLANDLLLRLRRRYAPGGVLQFGQGKWYPGEPLPRWAYGCYWRKDGGTVWNDPALLASLEQAGELTLADGERFARALAQRLGLWDDFLLPGYEDPFHHLLKEGQIPENLDPHAVRLEDSAERRHLCTLLERGLGSTVGYVLPLHWDVELGGWQSGRWYFRREQMFLLPGDSPMGFRLPLDALPWVAPEERPELLERSLFDEAPPLDDPQAVIRARQGMPPSHEEGPLRSLPQTAICFEVRQGRLYLFLPPLGLLEHYLDLIASIEATAAALKMPVVLEGYEPPRDLRLERLMVTPDPGVIEVNIHPAESWAALVEQTETLYHEARQARLGTEKFMLDGRHTGTGGGNHITIGGATPADSPVLRRPDLLRSLVTYWQHHPGLSYLFSGMFIGPTSQAPRVDEGRPDLLYELEIAFAQLPENGDVPPWLVDRLFRHLLVDITGNTHRAEFCIDKLYSPDSTSGRLGLVELRAFEMPPHARMGLVQALLLRSLIAWFWHKPYRHDLIRWGTQLHDRFLLPHYVERDLAQVCADLQEAGYPFELDWLAPFFEFRFPRYGTIQLDDIELEIRFAIEPWHVLGEEMSNQGTARFVDSSVERLQVRVRGLSGERYQLTCNGVTLPLHGTGRQGEGVAGVRYRAWQPPSALHPTIAPHTPLVFDLVDTFNGRSLGGCTYHVAHPAGRNYEVFPINAYEAEARRISRFWDFGHTPGVLTPPPLEGGARTVVPKAAGDAVRTAAFAAPQNEFPYTLDLRRFRL
ncbi:MAG: IMP dehydrogenase [Desulfuromonas sp.]|nr:MAG: IMP dehydrogenase [Desulfuromonas sp.]